MKHWDGGNSWGLLNQYNNMTGYYACAGTTVYYWGLETKYSENPLTPGFSVHKGAIEQEASDSKNCWVVGIVKYHGDPTSSSDDPCFFKINQICTAAGVKELLELPIFKEYGTTPISTTDWNALALQLYQAGMWFWTENGAPPIKAPAGQFLPVINLPFWMTECWDGSQLASVTSGNTINTNYTVNSANVPNNFSSPWAGAFNFNSTANITYTDDPAITGEVTIEYAGLKTGTSLRYICDARNDGGQWFLTNYSGYDWNWAGQLTHNSTGGVDPDERHHCIATAASAGNVSRLYLGGANGFGQAATGTANASLCTIGDNFTIGTRYTYSGTWNNMMMFFRVWDFVFDDTMAEMSWYHSKNTVAYPNQ